MFSLDKSDLSLDQRVTAAHALEFDHTYQRINQVLEDLFPFYMKEVVETDDDGDEAPVDTVDTAAPEAWRDVAVSSFRPFPISYR